MTSNKNYKTNNKTYNLELLIKQLTNQLKTSLTPYSTNKKSYYTIINF